MSEITIPKGSIDLAGLLFVPSSPPVTPTPALVIVHPGGGVKEQTASLYAKAFSKHPYNFTTVCYDAAYQGASGGSPHFLEDPNSRVSDVSAVIDYLSTLDSVDPEKIGVVGICAGGGYTIAAAKSDYRIKAVATVSMVNIGDSFRLGWDGKDPVTNHLQTLEMAAKQLAAEVKGEEAASAPYVPPQPDENTPYDLKQANDYYLTPRAQHPRAANKMLVRSFPLVLNFDAFHLADVFLKQPACLVVGEKAGSRWHTEKLDEMLKGNQRKVVISEGTHMDFYDKDKYVSSAVEEVGGFMLDKLA